MECVEEQGVLIGSPEWIACMEDILGAGLARLQDAPPSPPPLEAALQTAIGRLVEIEREVGKGPAASPVVVANVHHLRGVYHRRLIALGKLSAALSGRTEDDELYVILDALDAQGTEKAAQESVRSEKCSFGAGPPCQDSPTTRAILD